MKIYIENIKYFEHIKYSFETLFRCISKDSLEFISVNDSTKYEKGIYYGNNCPDDFRGIAICEGNLFNKDYLKHESIPTVPLKRYKDLIVPFYNNKDEINIQKRNNLFVINIDIIQGTFFFATGYEEIVSTDKRDEHSRFYSRNRILYKEYKYEKAIINEYAELLLKYCEESNFILIKRENKVFAHVSHDVDIPFSNAFVVKAVNLILKKLKLKKYQMKSLNKGFSTIIDEETKNNIHSSWYFMNVDDTIDVNYGYNIEDESIQKLIHNIKKNNNEIGIHYSYNAGFDKYQFEKEVKDFKNKLNIDTVVGRNHFLRYEIPYSWRLYAHNNVYYDASLASAEHEGFVYGICTPFELFDAIHGKNLHVYELPLIIMDATLIAKGYRSLNGIQATERINYYMNEVKKHNGVFSILWHNTNFGGSFLNVYRNTMLKIANEFITIKGHDIIAEYV